MSSDEEEGDEVYCICRSTDVSRFMIGCDNCEEWYHGDCIDVTEKDANGIKKFFCHVCRKKDPSLQIKYKVKKMVAGGHSDKATKDLSREKDKHKDGKTKESKDKDKQKETKSKDSFFGASLYKDEDKHKLAKHKEEKAKDGKHRDDKPPKDKQKEKHKDKSMELKIKEHKKKLEKVKEKYREKIREDKLREEKYKEDRMKEKQIEEKHKEEKHREEKHKEKHREDKIREEKHKERNHSKHDGSKATGSKSASKQVGGANSSSSSLSSKHSSKHLSSSSDRGTAVHLTAASKSLGDGKAAAKEKVKEDKPTGSLQLSASKTASATTTKAVTLTKAAVVPKTATASKVSTALTSSAGSAAASKSTSSSSSTKADAKSKSSTTSLSKSTANTKSLSTSNKTNNNSSSSSFNSKTLNSTNNVNSSKTINNISNNSKVLPSSTSNNNKVPISSSSNSSNKVPSSSNSYSASKGQTNNCSNSVTSNQLINKRLSIDLSSALMTGDRCRQCDACRVSHDCGACEACRVPGETCVKRRCRNLYQLCKRPSNSSSLGVPEVASTPASPPPFHDPSSRPGPRPLGGHGSEGEESDERPRSVLKDRNDRFSDDDWEPSRKALEQPDARANNTKTKKQKKGAASKGGGGRKRKGHSENPSLDPEGVGEAGDGARKQCQGPGCINPARPQSKYCSSECGLQLAQKRIFAILPQRINEFKLSGRSAEAQDTKKLEKIRRNLMQAQAEIQRLEMKCQELERVVERGLQETVDPRADEDMEEEGGEGQTVYCVTCGHEVATRRAIKHMENCFNKIESQTTFGSHYKTRIEGNTMFCDFYSAINRTYCKRLRVMCPEHYKEPKVPETRVCGAPLVRDVFTETGELCRASRKRCIKHYRWERLRRAEIDMERVRQWMKVDELFEQERQVLQSMTNRSGMLGLMLHSAYDHVQETRFKQQLKLQQEQQQQQQQQQQQTLQQQQQQQRLQQQMEQQKQQQQQPPQQKIITVAHQQQGPPTPQQQLAPGSNKYVSPPPPLHTDHRYFQSDARAGKEGAGGGRTSSTAPVSALGRLQHVDHQYYRPTLGGGSHPPQQQQQQMVLHPDGVGSGHLKLKVSHHKASVGGSGQKAIIHLQKSSGGPSYLQQQPQQQVLQPPGPPPTRYSTPGPNRFYQPAASEPRYHQDHQYHHSTGPQYQHPPQPRPQGGQQRPPQQAAPAHSDHMYFTNKRQQQK